MAWFHETLKDMETAIKAGNWDEVRKISDQHVAVLKGEEEKDLVNGILNAEVQIRNYIQCINRIDKLLKANDSKKLSNPYNQNIGLIKTFTTKAKNHMKKFEDNIKKLLAMEKDIE
jgi:hypothetical protein